MFEDTGGFIDNMSGDDGEWLWSEAWKQKDPSMWTMRDCAAYEMQMLCEEHDKTLKEQ